MREYKKENLIKKGNKIGIFKNDKNVSVMEHTHDYLEIVYVFSGESIHKIDGAKYFLNKGDVIFINYGSMHSISAVKNFSYYNISFSPDILENKFLSKENALSMLLLSSFNTICSESKGAKISFAKNERREIEFILESMIKEENFNARFSGRILENYLDIIFSKILQKTENISKIVSGDNVWEQLKEFIDNNSSEKITLTDLAKQNFYNPSYFSRVFKQKFGISLTEYINQKRFENAEKLLRETTLSVDKIMEKVGFLDKNAFYKAFVKKNGVTPAVFRKNNK